MYVGISAFLYWDHVKPNIPRDKNKTAKKLTNFLGIFNTDKNQVKGTIQYGCCTCLDVK
jgi:hypothetical protein